MNAMNIQRGGLRLDAHKERSTARPLGTATVPELLVLPLDQHAGAPARPLVKSGDRVRFGQPIAEPDGMISAWLHAPVSGVVRAIEPRPAPHRLGAPSLSIVLANDGKDERHETAAAVDFAALSPAHLREHIERGGMVGLGGAVFPTSVKLTSAESREGVRLLLNGAECEPYISCDYLLMRERARDVVLGARVLLHALGAQSCTIAVEDDTPDAERSLREAVGEAADDRLQLAVVASVYPAGGERQLITAVFGTEVPFDGLPSDIGVVCQNVGTAAAIAEWMRDGVPLVRRVVTVTGDGVLDAGNLVARLGTPISTLIEDCGGYTPRISRLIMGGSMMGAPLPHDDLPIVKATNCVLAASTLDLQPRSPEMPCIRCGACAEACPAFLLPQQIYWYARADDLEEADRYGLMDCIECGCCDYVCPSQIPLVERFRDTKPMLARMLSDRRDARAALTRFEARNERLQRLEIEQREALARKRQRS
jgi:Na+-translocating ferredoxin:NAD+ oxidoreductase subunit C